MKKIELLVPTDLHSIPLYQYQQFLKAFENPGNITEEEASLKMLEIFCGVTQKEGLKFKMSDVYIIVDKLNKILVSKPSLITKFTLGDQKFGFVPELSDLSFGEYIDAENNLGDWDNMHKAMSVLYRPIKDEFKDKYTLKEYDGVHYAEILKNMPTSVAVSCLVFFYALETELLNHTLNCSLETIMKKNQILEPKKILD
tara:strand:- start:221 stop:817 length:597 start_codon:yes stop_codon:yes gene_type:complete